MTTGTDQQTTASGAEELRRERERLEREQEFLLRSLDDLERERAAGGIDAESYERLHADYTARAAAVVRAIRDGVDTTPRAPRASTGRRIAVIGGLVTFAAVAAVALALGLGARLPGQTITGNAQDASGKVTNAQRERTLEAAVARNPNDASAHLTLARFRLGAGDGAGALQEFRAAAGLDPTNPEPFAYSGWILRLQGYPDQGLALLDKALQVNPAYPDAHFFKGLVLMRDKADPAAAVPELQQYLVEAPASPLGDQVRSLLAEAVKAAGPSATSTAR